MRVRATERCFIDNCLREAGEVFDYAGPAQPFLAPVEAPPAPAPVPPTVDELIGG